VAGRRDGRLTIISAAPEGARQADASRKPRMQRTLVNIRGEVTRQRNLGQE